MSFRRATWAAPLPPLNRRSKQSARLHGTAIPWGQRRQNVGWNGQLMRRSFRIWTVLPQAISRRCSSPAIDFRIFWPAAASLGYKQFAPEKACHGLATQHVQGTQPRRGKNCPTQAGAKRGPTGRIGGASGIPKPRRTKQMPLPEWPEGGAIRGSARAAVHSSSHTRWPRSSGRLPRVIRCSPQELPISLPARIPLNGGRSRAEVSPRAMCECRWPN